MPAMTDAPRPIRAKQLEQAARDARLAQALRDNLRRRKEQVRARAPGLESGLESRLESARDAEDVEAGGQDEGHGEPPA